MTEQCVGEVRVVPGSPRRRAPARPRRAAASSSSSPGKLERLPDLARRLALKARRVREQSAAASASRARPPGRYCESGSSRSSLPSSRSCRTARRGEGLRDRGHRVLGVGRRRRPASRRRRARRRRSRRARRPERRPRRGSAGAPRAAPRARGAGIAQARASAPSARGISSIARSMSSSPMSRCVTARRRVVGCTVIESPTPCCQSRSSASVGREPERSDVDLDEVGLDLLEVDGHAGLVEALREPPRAGVVVGEPVDVVVERVDPGRRDDPGLPHRTAEEVLQAPRFRHQLGRAGDRAPRADSRGPSRDRA